MLTLEGIYRPQIPPEAPHLHEPSALCNLQLLVLTGRNSSGKGAQQFPVCRALRVHDITQWYDSLIFVSSRISQLWQRRLREEVELGSQSWTQRQDILKPESENIIWLALYAILLHLKEKDLIPLELMWL